MRQANSQPLPWGSPRTGSESRPSLSFALPRFALLERGASVNAAGEPRQTCGADAWRCATPRPSSSPRSCDDERAACRHPDVLIAHDRKERAERERDDGAHDRPALMRDERLSDPLHHWAPRILKMPPMSNEPAEDGDDASPIARPKMMHIEDGEADGEREDAGEIDQSRAAQELSGHGPERLAFEQEPEADDHQHRAQDARDDMPKASCLVPPLQVRRRARNERPPDRPTRLPAPNQTDVNDA